MKYTFLFLLISCLIYFSCDKKEEYYLQPINNKIVLTIVNFNDVDKEQISLVKTILEERFIIDTILFTERKLPKNSFYSPKNRYRADSILYFLDKEFHTQKTIAVTAKDISTSLGKNHDWGILGLAFSPGKSAIVSNYRIKNKSENSILEKERFSKVVLHEFGHTFGLKHCKNSETCLMRAAEESVNNIDQLKDFCDVCRSKIKKHLKY